MTLAALCAALAFAGCGSSGSQPQASANTTTPTAGTAAANAAAAQSPTDSSAKGPHPLPINLWSPAVPPGTGEFPPILAEYTCDGANISPPLRWSNVPAGARELAIVIIYSYRSGENPSFAWGVAGLKPTLHGLSAGKLPAGAIVGRNSSGQVRYLVCPPKNKGQIFDFILYALPHHIPFRPGVQAESLGVRASKETLSVGQLRFSYKRP